VLLEVRTPFSRLGRAFTITNHDDLRSVRALVFRVRYGSIAPHQARSIRAVAAISQIAAVRLLRSIPGTENAVKNWSTHAQQK